MHDDSSSSYDGIYVANEATNTPGTGISPFSVIWILPWQNMIKIIILLLLDFTSPPKTVIDKDINGYFLFFCYFILHYQNEAMELE